MIERLARLFQFAGRARRREYWAVMVPVNLAMTLPVWLSSTRTNPASADSAMEVRVDLAGGLVFLALCVSAFALVLNYALGARRLHDRGWSAWWLLALYVAPPIMVLGAFNAVSPGLRDFVSAVALAALLVVLCSLILLGFVPGTRGSNRFGDDPKGRNGPEVFD